MLVGLADGEAENVEERDGMKECWANVLSAPV